MQLAPVRIYLIGMPGAGKSTMAKRLGQRLRWPWADTDAEVERRCGLPIAQLFAERGEAAFRVEERAALESLIERYADAVIATGGGLPAEPGSIERLNATGLTVWLDLPLGTLAQRLEHSRNQRPLLQQGELRQPLAQRLAHRTLYYTQARVRVEASSLSAEQLANILAPYLRAGQAPGPA